MNTTSLSSDIVCKWLGDSEHTIRSLFTVVRARQPSIFFIDDVDSLMRRRSNNEHETYRKIKTELLNSFGSDDGDRHNVVAIAATNRPQDIDNVYAPLPYAKLAQETDGYSYNDLVNLCREAVNIPLQSYSLEQKKNLRARDIRPITYNDMMTAMGRVPPSTNRHELADLLRWTDRQSAKPQ